jgi:hypothetical protein
MLPSSALFMVDSLPLLVYGQMFVRLELCIAPISLFYILGSIFL